MPCRYLGFIAVVLLVSLSASAGEAARGLIIRGQVVSIELRRTDPHYVDCRIDLSLEFTNRSSRPIIILRFDDENSPQSFLLGGVSLAKTQADAQAGRYIYNLQTWPSVDRSPSWKALAQQLDQPRPPKRLTRILQSNQSWTWSTSTQIRFFDKAWNQDRGWDEIGQLKGPLWLQLSCGMWPANLEGARPGIGKKLQRRWRGDGQLWLDYESTHNILVSEPMLMKLNESKLIASH